MDKTYHFAIDLGATSGRTILATFDGKKVEMQEISRFKNPMIPINGHLYWNLPGIYHEVLLGLKKCGETLAEISPMARLATIGIDTWGCDVAFFNADGSLGGLPHCYRDSHTEGAVERFSKKVPKEKTYALTGIQFMDFNTLFQLDTMMSNNADAVKKADKILFIPDALAFMLTGNAVTEYTVASTSQMLNPNTGTLDEELLSAIGIPANKFGKIVNPRETIGTLSKDVQAYTGLGDVPVIAVAGHDTASAVIAVPTPDKNYAYLSCGTWSLLGVESEKPVITDKSRQYNFTNEGGIDGTTRLLKNICGLWLFERCRDEFKDAPTDVAELSALYLSSQCESIINPDDPAFAHPEVMTRAINSYCAQTRQEIPETPADYIRVIFRSLAKRYNEVLGMLREIAPVKIDRLHVIGGGSYNKYLMQLTADETGIPVVAGPGECTALGNILVQLRACGRVGDLNEMRNVAINSTETKNYLPKQS